MIWIALAAWVPHAYRSRVTTYFVHPSLYHSLTWPETLLGLPMPSEDVDTLIRYAFLSWQDVAPALQFRQVSSAGNASVVLTAAPLLDPVIATHTYDDQYIRISTETCWVRDGELCHVLHPYALAMHIVVCGCAFVLVVVSLMGDRWMKTVTSGVLIVLLLFECGVVLPCESCHTFVNTLLHEIGHAVGLMHPNDVSHPMHYCGCGKEARKCERSPLAPLPVMVSYTHARRHTCLSPDDIDGVRTLWDRGSCGAPSTCYPPPRVGGDLVARLTAYLLFATSVAYIQHYGPAFVRRHRPRCRAQTEPVAPPCDAFDKI